jgi:hypothetical protein
MAARLSIAALLLIAAAASAPDPVGRYRLQGEHDVASELIIARDGHFEYALAAGALDEEASGPWRRVGNEIRLTTRPKPVPPAFSAGAARKVALAPLTLHVTWPGGRDAVGTDFRIDFDAGPPLITYVGGPDGWTMPEEETRKPVAVTFALTMFDVESQRFPIDTAKANDLSFLITPHDLGKVDFQDVVLDVEPGRLVMHRGQAKMTYVKER